MNTPLHFFSILDTQSAKLSYLRVVNFTSKGLFDIDVMNTGCVENDNYSEYGEEADEIVKLVMCGFPLVFAVKTVFDASFWDDCLNEETLNNVCEKLSKNF